MPASRRASLSDAAVSEVVGQILIFGIMGMVLLLSLLGFNAAKQGAEERVESVEAEAIAQRLAGVVVDMALFAERSDASAMHVVRTVDLPAGLQGDSYTVHLRQDDVEVRSGGTVLATAKLFSSGAPDDVVVCDTAVDAGAVHVVASHTPPAGCSGGGSPVHLFLSVP